MACAGRPAASSAREGQHSLCFWVMRLESLWWDNRIFMSLGKTYFHHTWVLWVRACSQWLQYKCQLLLWHQDVSMYVCVTFFTPKLPSTKTIWKLLFEEQTPVSALWGLPFIHIFCTAAVLRKCTLENSNMPLYFPGCHMRCCACSQECVWVISSLGASTRNSASGLRPNNILVFSHIITSNKNLKIRVCPCWHLYNHSVSKWSALSRNPASTSILGVWEKPEPRLLLVLCTPWQ